MTYALSRDREFTACMQIMQILSVESSDLLVLPRYVSQGLRPCCCV